MKLPPLFDFADQTATRARIRHEWTVWAQLIAGFLVPLVGIVDRVAGKSLGLQPEVANIGVAGLFLLGFGLGMTELFSRSDRTWVETRSAAETLRSLAWRYVSHASPFEGPDAEAEYRREAKGVAERHLHANGRTSALETMTPEMQAMREQPFDVRRHAYRTDRMAGQEAWYRQRARQANRGGSVARIVVFGLQLLGIVVALDVLVAPGDVDLGFVELIAVAAASLLAWTLLKDHRRTASRYELMAADLEEAGKRVDDLEASQFGGFVVELEHLVSREVVDWATRRRTH